jgi:hypothetical protein
VVRSRSAKPLFAGSIPAPALGARTEGFVSIWGDFCTFSDKKSDKIRRRSRLLSSHEHLSCVPLLEAGFPTPQRSPRTHLKCKTAGCISSSRRKFEQKRYVEIEITRAGFTGSLRLRIRSWAKFRASLTTLSSTEPPWLRKTTSFATLTPSNNSWMPLSIIPAFDQDMKVLRESELYRTTHDDLAVTANRATELKAAADHLYFGALGLKDILNTTLTPPPAESIVVTLPSQTELSSVVEVLADLQSALNPLVQNEKVGGQVNVARWESGSLIAILFLQTPAAVWVVSRALHAAAMAYHEFQKARLLRQQVKNL